MLSKLMRSSEGREGRGQRSMSESYVGFIRGVKKMVEENEVHRQKEEVSIPCELICDEMENIARDVGGVCLSRRIERIKNNDTVTRLVIDVSALDGVSSVDLVNDLVNELESKGYIVTKQEGHIISICCVANGIQVILSIIDPAAKAFDEHLASYQASDGRVKALLPLILAWSSSQSICNNGDSTCSHRAWAALLLYFLQFVHPPMMPDLSTPLDSITLSVDSDAKSLSQLLFEFWKFIYDSGVMVSESDDCQTVLPKRSGEDVVGGELLEIGELAIGEDVRAVDGSQPITENDKIVFGRESLASIFGGLLKNQLVINECCIVILLANDFVDCSDDTTDEVTTDHSGTVASNFLSTVCAPVIPILSSDALIDEDEISFQGRPVDAVPTLYGEILSNQLPISSEFEDIVLGWKIRDVLNTDLFASELHEIPTKFDNYEQFRQLMQPFVLEEMREQIAQKLSNDSELLGLQRCDNLVLRIDEANEYSRYLICAATPEEKLSKSSFCFQLLCERKLDSLRHEGIKSMRHAFCETTILISAKETKTKFEEALVEEFAGHPIFKVLIRNEEVLQELLTRPRNGWELVALNIGSIASQRVYRVLNKGDNSFASHILQNILSGTATVEDEHHSQWYFDDNEYLGTVNPELTSSLNESQRLAIGKVIYARLEYSLPRIQLIKGPPGTGKTATLVALLENLSKLNVRVHACAPNNIAISELARRYLRQYGSKLHEVLLIGERHRLDIDDALESILLKGRIQRINDSIAYLKATVSQYLMALIPTGSGLSVEDLDKSSERLGEMLEQIILSVRILLNEAPTYLVDFKAIADIIGTMPSRISPSIVKSWFGNDSGKGNEIFPSALRSLGDLLRIQEWKTVTEDYLVSNAMILFSTVNVSARRRIRVFRPNVVLIDEATQVNQAESMLPIQWLENEENSLLVLVGDEKQLSSTVFSKYSDRYDYGMSLFARLVRLEYPLTLLNVQYRMHPMISRFPTSYFYDGILKDGANVRGGEYSKYWHSDFAPVSVFDINYGHESRNEGGSKYNDCEIHAVKKIIDRFRHLHRQQKLIDSSVKPISVVIISPYKLQIEYCREFCSAISPGVIVSASTIDGYQGQEADVVIFTAVRSNSDGSIGFLRDERRLNVAITRARFTLIIVCNATMLRPKEGHWGKLLNHLNLQSDSQDFGLVKKISESWHQSEDQIEKLITGSSTYEQLPWKLEFSGKFRKALSTLVPEIKKEVLKVTTAAAAGRHSWSSTLVDEAYRDVIWTDRAGHYFVLLSVDITEDRQAIKLWDICTNEKLKKAISDVVSRYNKYSPEFVDLCRRNWNRVGKKKIFVVRHFDRSEIVPKMKADAPSNSTSDNSASETISTTETVELAKFYPVTSRITRILFEGSEAQSIELPFVMSSEENDIVRCPGSAFILGRSGTGKTTVLLHRMYFCTELWKRKIEFSPDFVQEQDCIRQMLLTASPLLCDHIRKSYHSMCKILESQTDLSFETAASVAVSGGTTGSNTSLVDDNDASVEYQSKCIRKISDDKYPLILTYADLLGLVDRSLPIPFSSKVGGEKVDFFRFEAAYYPHFDTTLSASLSAYGLYSEFLSSIKGSIEALRSKKGYISLADYVKLGTTRSGSVSGLSEQQRRSIYKLFQHYEKQKGANRDFDKMDMVHYIYHALSTPDSIPLPHMMHIYIDEVQDLLPGELAILKFLCRSPSGFMFAGDTAQTIAHGVGFRFETVKDVFYQEIFEEIEQGEKREYMPKIKHLTENFRTHSQIVKIANSVVKLIVRFFPFSIDELDPERSSVVGPLPVFVTSIKDIIHDLFHSADGTRCEFNANQVILVRDETTKKEVSKETNDRALVLTALECKGMEFADVVVYNFFSTSPLDNEWRALYSIINERIPHPKFDLAKHAGLCLELKLLYVLLTRTCRNLFLFETAESRKKAEPMLEYWENTNIEMRHFDEGIRTVFASESSPEEWKARGFQFFERNQFKNARLCFHRAGDEYNENICKAEETAQSAEKSLESSPNQATQLFLEAARSFEKLELTVKAAKCYERANEYKRAAKLYALIEKHEAAAKCYEQVNMWKLAADQYEKVALYSEIVRCCLKGHEYKYLLGAIDRDKSQYVPELRQKCAMTGVMYYHVRHDQKNMIHLVREFSNVKDKYNWLERNRYVAELIGEYVADSELLQAANLSERNGHYEDAAKYYLESNDSVSSARCVIKQLRLKKLNCDFDLGLLDSKERLDIENLKKNISLDKSPAESKSLCLELELFTAESLDKLREVASCAKQFGYWRLQYTAERTILRKLLNAENKATEPAPKLKGRNRKAVKATSQVCNTAIDVENIEKAINELQAMASEMITTLRKKKHNELDISQLTSLEIEKLNQCLDFFEVRPVDRRAYSRISDDSLVTGPGIDFLMNSSSSTPSMLDSTIKLTFQEFAQKAILFLEQVEENALKELGTILASALSRIKVRSVKDYFDEFLNQSSSLPAFQSQVPERIKLLLVSKNIKVKLAQKEGYIATTEDRNLMRTILPDNPYIEGIFACAVARKMCRETTVFREAVERFTTTTSHPYPCEILGRVLLFSEILGTANISRVCKSLRTLIDDETKQELGRWETSYRKYMTVHFPLEYIAKCKSDRERKLSNLQSYARTRLVRSFEWENANTGTPPVMLDARNISHQPSRLLHSAIVGANALISYWSRENFSKLVKPSSDRGLKEREKEELQRIGCFSPSTTIKFFQKYAILLLLQARKFHNCFIPESLAVDVFLKCNPALFDEVSRQFREQTSLSPLQSNFARKKLLDLFEVMVDMLSLTSTSFDTWIQTHDEALTLNSELKIGKQKVDEARNSFYFQLVALMATCVMNDILFKQVHGSIALDSRSYTGLSARFRAITDPKPESKRAAVNLCCFYIIQYLGRFGNAESNVAGWNSYVSSFFAKFDRVYSISCAPRLKSVTSFNSTAYILHAHAESNMLCLSKKTDYESMRIESSSHSADIENQSLDLAVSTGSSFGLVHDDSHEPEMDGLSLETETELHCDTAAVAPTETIQEKFIDRAKNKLRILAERARSQVSLMSAEDVFLRNLEKSFLLLRKYRRSNPAIRLYQQTFYCIIVELSQLRNQLRSLERNCEAQCGEDIAMHERIDEIRVLSNANEDFVDEIMNLDCIPGIQDHDETIESKIESAIFGLASKVQTHVDQVKCYLISNSI